MTLRACRKERNFCTKEQLTCMVLIAQLGADGEVLPSKLIYAADSFQRTEHLRELST